MNETRKTILIIGGLGMLGHQLYKTLKSMHEVRVSIRGTFASVAEFGIFAQSDICEGVDANEFDSIVRVFAATKPDVVVNAVGLVKQLFISNDPLSAITINSLFPHKLAWLCAASNARLIHISTDCVFSGKKGNYVESDNSDAEDLYGRTKFLGEVSYEPHSLTLRTSIIGREIKNKVGLVEWFLQQRGAVSGYKNAIYTGFTTIELAKIINEYVIPNEKLAGLYQVSSEIISKYELLTIIRDVYRHSVEIKANTEFVCDRSLNSDRFRNATGYVPPAWGAMIQEMYNNQ